MSERHEIGVNRLVREDQFQSTEYLHRTVEAMETIRHRAFHGEGVFPDEVMTSNSHGSQTMSLLTRTTQDECVDHTLDALELLKRSRAFGFPDPKRATEGSVCISRGGN